MVWASLLRVFEAAHWQTWAAVLGLAGLGVLAFVGGRRIFGSAPPPPPPEPQEAPVPERDPFLVGSASEKRQAARRKGGVIEVLLSDEGAKADPWKAVVVDRSLGGVCVGGTRRVEPGTVLTLRPLAAPPGTPWLEVRVRSCRQDAEGWVLGCQFVRIPPTSLRLLFG
jgi:hypothetical protein